MKEHLVRISNRMTCSVKRNKLNGKRDEKGEMATALDLANWQNRNREVRGSLGEGR